MTETRKEEAFEEEGEATRKESGIDLSCLSITESAREAPFGQRELGLCVGCGAALPLAGVPPLRCETCASGPYCSPSCHSPLCEARSEMMDIARALCQRKWSSLPFRFLMELGPH